MPRPPLIAPGLALALALGAGTAAAERVYVPRLMPGWDINRDGVVSFQEFRIKRRAIFSQFDANGDGALDAREAAAFDAAGRSRLRHLDDVDAGERRAVAASMRMMRADIDGNGRISRDEFRLGIIDWLAMLDQDGDGRLSLYDFGGAD